MFLDFCPSSKPGRYFHCSQDCECLQTVRLIHDSCDMLRELCKAILWVCSCFVISTPPNRFLDFEIHSHVIERMATKNSEQETVAKGRWVSNHGTGCSYRRLEACRSTTCRNTSTGRDWHITQFLLSGIQVITSTAIRCMPGNRANFASRLKVPESVQLNCASSSRRARNTPSRISISTSRRLFLSRTSTKSVE